MMLFIMLFFHLPVMYSTFGLNILSTLFSNTLNLFSSLRVRDQVSYPYKMTYKIIKVFQFLYRR